MSKPRPCDVCHVSFVPHPRAGDRQRTCSDPACQRERHRRACASWHDRNPAYDRSRRALSRFQPVSPPPGPALQQTPIARIPWDTVRELVGGVLAGVLETSLQQVYDWARDAVAEETSRLRREVAVLRAEIASRAARDAFAGQPAGP